MPRHTDGHPDLIFTLPRSSCPLAPPCPSHMPQTPLHRVPTSLLCDRRPDHDGIVDGWVARRQHDGTMARWHEEMPRPDATRRCHDRMPRLSATDERTDGRSSARSRRASCPPLVIPIAIAVAVAIVTVAGGRATRPANPPGGGSVGNERKTGCRPGITTHLLYF